MTYHGRLPHAAGRPVSGGARRRGGNLTRSSKASRTRSTTATPARRKRRRLSRRLRGSSTSTSASRPPEANRAPTPICSRAVQRHGKPARLQRGGRAERHRLGAVARGYLRKRMATCPLPTQSGHSRYPVFVATCVAPVSRAPSPPYDRRASPAEKKRCTCRRGR